MVEQRGRRVLLSGATGMVGGAVARGLLAAGHHVRALVRNPTHEKARALQALGVELWEGRLEEPDSVTAAAQGVDAFFLHTVPWWVGAPKEAALALGAARAAAAARLPHLILSSAAGANANSGFVVLEAKGEMERGLKDVAVATQTVVAPAFLMDNFLHPLWFGGIANGTFPIPVPAHTPLQMVALQDVAAVVARIVEQPQRFAGQRVELAAHAPTLAEVATILSQTTGRTVEHQLFPLEEVERINPALAFLFRFLAGPGHGVDLAAVRARLPDVPLRTLHTWAQTQDWSVLDAPPPPPPADHDHQHDHG